MKIELRFYGELRKLAGADVLPLVVDAPISLTDVLGWLRSTHPQLADVLLVDAKALSPDINLLINGTPARPSNGSELTMDDGDRLFFLRAYGGG